MTAEGGQGLRDLPEAKASWRHDHRWRLVPFVLLIALVVVATIAGVGLTVLVGTGLMGLVFLSNRTGHDEDAAGGRQDDRE